MVYAQDHVASITPSVQRLRDFNRVFVGPGETVSHGIELPVRALSFVHKDLMSRVEPGTFTLIVAGESMDFKIE